ncbi:hypothetical protein [Sphingopyxis yananensis]|uniref:hypothetical protein n=1 Tax=Sphingopyxis yananensis TaxID=2886687 RepID=UPI001D0FD19A|nr:hypothetical protein [Sphingopyxis yananensis]MCC2603042.1 hypothetical protein [Sphingopyxis yananensis]
MSAHGITRRTYCDCIECVRVENRHRLKIAGWMLLVGPIATSAIVYNLGKLCL